MLSTNSAYVVLLATALYVVVRNYLSPLTLSSQSTLHLAICCRFSLSVNLLNWPSICRPVYYSLCCRSQNLFAYPTFIVTVKSNPIPLLTQLSLLLSLGTCPSLCCLKFAVYPTFIVIICHNHNPPVYPTFAVTVKSKYFVALCCQLLDQVQSAPQQA